MSTTEDMVGRKTKPENEKVRSKRMALIDEKINKLKLKYLTIENNNRDLKEKIAKHEGTIETYDKQIEVLRAEKEKLLKHHTELSEMNLAVDDLATVKKEKEGLESQVQKLKLELKEVTKSVESLLSEEITFEE